ncbi:MAG: 4'-phosphopantetheinyl transferase superfamily protein [Bradymonadia bacterium]
MNQAVLGVGLDVCDVNRIAKLRKKSAFIYEIMSPTEAAAPPRSDEEIAFLWATKEAVAKSLGIGFWQKNLAFSDITVGPTGDIALTGAAALHAGAVTFNIDRWRQDNHVVVKCVRLRAVRGRL